MSERPDERLGLLLKRAEQTLINAKTAALKPTGLSVPQYAALLFLEHEPGLSSAALARRALVTSQTMGPLLITLEKRGLIERRPHPIHRRVVEVFLTPAGRELLNDADARALRVEAAMITDLTEAEQQHLRSLLQRAIGGLLGTERDKQAAA